MTAHLNLNFNSVPFAMFAVPRDNDDDEGEGFVEFALRLAVAAMLIGLFC